MEILLFIIMMACGQLLFKAASLSLRPADSPMSGALAAIGEWKFLLALALYLAATFLWMKILKQMPLSTAYPLAMGATIAITYIAGMIIYRETFSLFKAIGTTLIVIAIFLISK
ncbi:MAG: SMR family transporter [Cyanobacteriota bacterium]|nr:SMR family transporter [Cyanobacteriota bacterium]